MKYFLFDVVILISGIPERGFKAGMKGAIVDVYSEQEEAYEVELYDEDGRTIYPSSFKLPLCWLHSFTPVT